MPDAGVSDLLERGREAHSTRAWDDAYTALSQAAERVRLGADDLERLATSASMTGRMDEYLTLLEQVHHEHLERGDELRAARAAFWAGMTLATSGDMGPAGGWFSRAHRLIERHGADCVEAGYLRIPVAFQLQMAGEYEAAYAAAAEGRETAERFNDAALIAACLHVQGQIRVRQGMVPQGLALLDEAMVALTAPDIPPMLSGVVYCGVIACCEDAFDVRRAHEWTTALARWCSGQPQLVSFTGRCLAHRAGIMRLHGAWNEALAEARLARDRCEQSMNRAATGQAIYQQAELHRLRGEFGAAEAAYREASLYGREPQPGLALLRLAQGEVETAAAALRRAVSVTTTPMARAAVLPAYAEAMLAAGDVGEAADATDELTATAAQSGSEMLAATAAHLRGAVALAAGEPEIAVSALRTALLGWQKLEAPYEVARARLLTAIAWRALGDEDGAALELESARATFEELGAAPDIAKATAAAVPAAPADTHGLTTRELDVLRLVAEGRTNREIAAALVVSEHTVARHVQNIYAKLRVSTRSAATAFAFEHRLV
jgi:DNA-binding NarL/FixJ family response regulator